MAVDRDLTIACDASSAGVLADDADGLAALLGEAGIVEDQHTIPLSGRSEHVLDALEVEVALVLVHAHQQALEPLRGGVGDDRGEGIAVLVEVLGEQAGEIAFEDLISFAASELNMERAKELVQPRPAAALPGREVCRLCSPYLIIRSFTYS